MKIKNKELLRTIKYALIAISAGVIQFVSSTILKLILDQTALVGQRMFFITDTEKTAFISETIGLVLSVVWNCTFNRKYTFKAANNVPLAMCLALLFYVPFYPFQIWYMATIQNALADIGFWAFLISLVTCMIINGVLEFLWQRFVVFRKSLDTNSAAQKEAAREEQQDGEEDGVEVTNAEGASAETDGDNATADNGGEIDDADSVSGGAEEDASATTAEQD